jgi:hypothetical protein
MPDTATSGAMTEPVARREREHRRRAVLWPARLIIPGCGDVRCVVIDLADGGARLLAETPVPVGTSVKLRSSRLVRTAYVAWSADGCIGLRFTAAVPAVAKAFDSQQG